MFEENKEICRRFFEEAYGKGNLRSVDDCVTQKCRLHDPVFPSLAPGSESLKSHIRGIRNAFPDLSCTCDDIIAERDEVVVHWTCRGTQRGEFLNFPATNRQAMVSGTSIHRLENSKIAEIWTEWNLQSLLDQLGVGMNELESNRALARRYVDEIWNRKKPEMIGHFVSNDFVMHSPNGLQRGAAGLRQSYDQLTTGIPDCHLQIDDVTCEGDRAVVRCTLTGTQTGKLQDMAPSGRMVRVPSIAILRISNGKIAEEHLLFDRLTMMQQIGAVSEPAMAHRAQK